MMKNSRADSPFEARTLLRVSAHAAKVMNSPMTATQIPARPAAAYESAFPNGPRPDPVEVDGRPQSLIRRFAERFALIAFGLYHVPLFLNNYPSLGGGGFNDIGLAARWGHVFTIPSLWVARYVFHIAHPGGASGDNGDVSEEYARLLLAVVIGILGALAWTIADRRRPRGTWVESTLRVLLRYSIALGLMSYGIAKIFPQQFPPIATATLDRRVGDLTPMALLWTFMQYSRPYAFFGGVMELVAAALLCFRRTATLGALVCLAVMTNVAFLNYAYGVPVKLYATMILLSAAVLVIYDAPWLFDVFVRGRSAGPSRESTVLQDRIPRAWRRVIEVAAVGSVALSSVAAMTGTLKPSAPSSPLEGTWRVISPSPSAAWRRFSIMYGGMMIRTAGDSTFGCRLNNAAAGATATLTCAGGHGGDIRWARTRDTLRIEGAFDSLPVSVTATSVDRTSYPLMRGRFRWIVE